MRRHMFTLTIALILLMTSITCFAGDEFQEDNSITDDEYNYVIEEIYIK